ncbi:MAG: hypothetical protein AB8I08_04035 [Sandaracinaceae bacterium]
MVRSANSVIFDWVGRTTNLLRRPTFDEVGNHHRPGAITVSPIQGYLVNKYQLQGDGPASIYTAGNVVDELLDAAGDNRTIWSYFDPGDGRGTDNDPVPASWFRSSPLPVQPGCGLPARQRRRGARVGASDGTRPVAAEGPCRTFSPRAGSSAQGRRPRWTTAR